MSNSFEISNNRIYISNPEWNFIATTTLREDYVDEIINATWGLKNGRYPYNSKLGTLHSFIMKKWYGEETCKEMKEQGYVIDHIDNISHNCCIENLAFLSDAYNKAKGLTFDQENKDKSFIALSIFKNFETGLYQITIVFNYPATLNLAGFDKNAVIELVYLLYEGDYRRVIQDAHNILLDYYESYTFNPEKLRMIDYDITGCIGKAASPEIHKEYINGQHKRTVFLFHKKAPLNNWTKESCRKSFIISDIGKGYSYKIDLLI